MTNVQPEPREIVTVDRSIIVPPRRWRVIIDETCQEYGLRHSRLLIRPYGPRKYMKIRIALVRRLFAAGYSLSYIGRLIMRDHSTVAWYLGRHGNKRQPTVWP